MKLTKTGVVPALIIDPYGNMDRPPIAPEELISSLDRSFSNRPSELARKPGKLSNMLQSLPPRNQNEPVSPKLSVAVCSSHSMTMQDLTVERSAAEIGMLAQRDGYFHCNNHPMIEKNGWKPTLEQIEEISIKIADIYLLNNLINFEDKVLDVGSGHGFFAKYLESKGYEVKAIDPLPWMEDREKPAFLKTEKITSKEYIEKYPEEKFSVVTVCNFSPNSTTNILDMDEARKLIEEASHLTANEGVALIGISSMDPQFVSGASEYRLRPHLESNFIKVEYFSPKKVGQDFSIGGQMGFFKCSK